MKLLTDKEEYFLNNLANLLHFGSSLLQDAKIMEGQEFYKSNYLLLTFAAIHNYTEAVYVLCKDARPHSAIVLLRSVLEAHLNMNYAMNTNSNKRLALFVVADMDHQAKTVRGFLELIRKYPHWEGKYGITTKKVLDGMVSKNETQRNQVRRLNKLKRKDKLPTLLERAMEYDRKISSKNKKGEMEFNYHLIYRQFSDYAHLNPTGIYEFSQKLPDGNRAFDIGRSKRGVEPIITTAFAWYIGLLGYLKQWGVIPKNTKLTKFKQILKSMNTSLDNYHH